MPGGSLHWPIWSPYALYGSVDYVYGWPAYNDGLGFTAAQGFLNVVESAMYLYYLYKVMQCDQGSGWYKVWNGDQWKRKTVVQSDGMATAVLVCFASATMTLSKTLLYGLHEYYSNFENIGHNDWSTLIPIWIIPNGAWLVGSSWMVYNFGREVVASMDRDGGDDGAQNKDN